MKVPVPIVALALIFSCTEATAGCPSNRNVTTLEGHFAAMDRDGFSEMVAALRRNETGHIHEMLASGRLVELPAGKQACLLERPFHSTRFRIRIDGDDRTYWVLRYAVELNR